MQNHKSNTMMRRAFIANLLFGGAALSVTALSGSLLAQTTPDEPKPSPSSSPVEIPPALRGDVAPVMPQKSPTPYPPKTAGAPVAPRIPKPSPSPTKTSKP